MEHVTDYPEMISAPQGTEKAQGDAKNAAGESAELDAMLALERAITRMSLRDKALLVGDVVEPLRELRGA